MLLMCPSCLQVMDTGSTSFHKVPYNQAVPVQIPVYRCPCGQYCMPPVIPGIKVEDLAIWPVTPR